MDDAGAGPFGPGQVGREPGDRQAADCEHEQPGAVVAVEIGRSQPKPDGDGREPDEDDLSSVPRSVRAGAVVADRVMHRCHVGRHAMELDQAGDGCGKRYQRGDSQDGCCRPHVVRPYANGDERPC